MKSPTLDRLPSKTLREQVYERLRAALQSGEIRAGSPLKLDALSQALGISRTPLREALLQLETEGFVEILPRRGCMVRRLDAQEICELYQLIGAMEAAVLREHGSGLDDAAITRMRELDSEMRFALEDDDFERYYTANLDLHEVYLSRSQNSRLRRWVEIWKRRLYDFPRRVGYVKEWELSSCEEHSRLIELLESGEVEAAAEFVQNVHWSYEVQSPYIQRYYFDGSLPNADLSSGVVG